jgi:methylthioribose-1-phosphate isomerase
MGAYGSAALLEAASKTSRWLSQGGKIRVLTHCNTGEIN